MEGLGLPAFPQFDNDLEPTSVGSQWTKYIHRFQKLLVVMNITDDKRQKALLFHYTGQKVQDIFEAEQNYDHMKFDETVKALTEHLQPRRNTS